MVPWLPITTIPKMDSARASAHYGADHMMVDEIVSFLKGEVETLPVGVVDAVGGRTRRYGDG